MGPWWWGRRELKTCEIADKSSVHWVHMFGVRGGISLLHGQMCCISYKGAGQQDLQRSGGIDPLQSVVLMRETG